MAPQQICQILLVQMYSIQRQRHVRPFDVMTKNWEKIIEGWMSIIITNK